MGRLTTYANQEDLPSLPVPDLEQTARKYLDSVAPFVTPEELRHTTELMNEFVGPNGQAHELHKMLLERAATERNWLADWWEYAGYTSYRAPTAIDINMISGFGSFAELDQPVPQNRRAAEIIRYTAEYHELLLRELVPPETMGRRPMCMNMFKRIFSSCRVPAVPADTYERLDGAKPIDHVVVFCRGYPFALRVYDTQRRLLSIGDLERQLQFIARYAQSFPTKMRVGALTAAQRDEWAAAREALLPLGDNAAHLALIQESLFAVCLDEAIPTTPTACLQRIAAGEAHNRWFDKSLQFIVFANGNAGCNMEHGNADATVYRSVFEWLGRRYLTRSGSLETAIESTSDAFLPPPTLLCLEVPPAVETAIARTEHAFAAKAARFQACVTRHKALGRTRIKAELRVPPDTYVQLAIQHAAWTLWGRPLPTYESAHTRWFALGRTETIRSCSSEVAAWLAAPDGPAGRERFAAAVAKHQALAVDALGGQGVDRHLLGLQVAAAVAGLAPPPVFADAAFVRSGGNGNFVLSTSNVSGYEWLWGGFAPMVDYGVGVCYSVEPTFIGYTVTSMAKAADDATTDPVRRVSCHEFAAALTNSLDALARYVCDGAARL
ncbi:choline/Carnitine O-acyltransferase [Achlya hypogyna]|uniref:Choline/Carnitine O-acyltransferase n=1 Tax=Achlya hypogyna TaxID=1202772 RepID=A0A1V9ZVC4_ACHHY|nr:choline/Carnitine O-acyltransferase [Achlya hypogyna]